jgi:phosphoglycerate dehydrogenase-like enzyme
MHDRRPAVLYMPMDGLDVSAGKAVLRAAGFDVFDILERPPGDADLERVLALLAGYDRVGADWFDRLPALRVVATHSAGVDMVDLAEARRHGITVAPLTGAATREVAAHALAMALALIRRLPQLHRSAVNRHWEPPRNPPGLPQELTCGVVGMGRIGRAFAALASGVFGAVIGYDPELPDELWPTRIARMSLPELLSRSDCVSLHLALTDKTRAVIDSTALRRMPPGSIVVNVARGELVDEHAMAEALRSGRLAGAACDVLTEEPPRPDHPYLQDERVLMSPHAAFLSPSSLRVYAEQPAHTVVALLAGRDVPHIVEGDW